MRRTDGNLVQSNLLVVPEKLERDPAADDGDAHHRYRKWHQVAVLRSTVWEARWGEDTCSDAEKATARQAHPTVGGRNRVTPCTDAKRAQARTQKERKNSGVP